MMSIIALFEAVALPQTPVETFDLGGNHNILYLFWQADIVVKFALLLLFIFSIISWAIIIMKHRQLKSFKKRTHQFLYSFWQSKNIETLVSKGAFRKSPVFTIFKSGVTSLKDPENSKNIAFVRRDIARTAEEEIEQLEYYVPFLATTASAAPFIGLFGTVWGILNAFWKLGRGGSSSIAVIGPHIAEALIATAIGLAAAIPAVIFYNFFVNKIRLLTRDITQFSEDLSHRIEKEYFK
ncbi:MAG: MotA/TolQ/ExbB proton channel family protein [Deltaproteobacteria bacterium]|nr:MotA/TolQ/ExbB proton channel family protein [Deltaproteobacteria bacterium]MBI2342049.1 MotA/TolQ/ExbB proton channel family protein [Deltaproteobacteria bacterium]MBI2974523.1 MotA/TolQ/ExbB proton channel family protein [Deltaproteobacteria bacterium]